MNNMELNVTSGPPDSRAILYFRFRENMGSGIEQVEYDLLQTNLSRHRGADEPNDAPRSDGYWSVAVTSEKGVGADAVEYTTNYLRSMATIDALSITATPPPAVPF
jgi:hypothetical protein